MANRIKGITIDIGANTVKLTDALKDVDKSLKATQSDLNDVNRLLKLDPKNTELLSQKQKLLATAIESTKTRQSELNEALKQMVESGDTSEAAVRQQEALKREIESTNIKLQEYQDQFKNTGKIVNSAMGTISDSLKDVDKNLEETQSDLNEVNRLLKLDPKNTELLSQKQTLLSTAIENTKTKQKELNKALEQMKESGDNSDAAIQQQEELKRAIAETDATLRDYQGQLKSTGNSLSGFADKTADLASKTMALSATAAGLLGSLTGMAIGAGMAADDLNTMAKQTGFSTEELQKMQYASDRIDVSMETIAGAASKLTKTLASSEEKFTSLGVATRNVDGSFRDVSDIFYQTIERLSEISNETERDTQSMEIFGKSANELAGIIDDGGAALKSFGQEAEDAGLILSQDALDAANGFNDALDELKAKAEAAFLKSGAALAENLIPALEKLLEVGEKVLAWVANMDSETLTAIVSVLALSAALSPVLSALSKGIELMGTLHTAVTTATAAGIPGLVTALGTILPVLAAIAASAALVLNILEAINLYKRNQAWKEYTENQTAGMTQITADQAKNWMNTGEVQTMVNPAGEKVYYVANSDYSWDKANSAANGWNDAAVWGNNAVNMTVNVDHIDDLQDLLDIADTAQLVNRMG